MDATPQEVKGMYQSYRAKTKIVLFAGLALLIGGAVIVGKSQSTGVLILGVLLSLVSLYFYLTSCAIFGTMKGYKPWVGQLCAAGGLVGLIILFVLPEREQGFDFFLRSLESVGESLHKKILSQRNK